MQLRITERTEASVQVIKVDGKLTGEATGELVRVLGSAVDPVRLDLSGLRGVDDLGVQCLRDLDARGVELSEVPLFITILINSGRKPKTEPPP